MTWKCYHTRDLYAIPSTDVKIHLLVVISCWIFKTLTDLGFATPLAFLNLIIMIENKNSQN